MLPETGKVKKIRRTRMITYSHDFHRIINHKVAFRAAEHCTESDCEARVVVTGTLAR